MLEGIAIGLTSIHHTWAPMLKNVGNGGVYRCVYHICQEISWSTRYTLQVLEKELWYVHTGWKLVNLRQQIHTKFHRFWCSLVADLMQNMFTRSGEKINVFKICSKSETINFIAHLLRILTSPQQISSISTT